MAIKGTLTFEQLKLLTDLEGSYYVSKSGIDYINGLASVFQLNNLNDKPFTISDIKRQPKLDDFRFSGKNDFTFICKLKANPMKISLSGERENEKIVAFDFAGNEAQNIFNKSLGVAYIITCMIDANEYIVKFGQSRTTFKSRLGSYNCGTVNNWRTASTTNIKMLQSMVTTRCIFKLYLCDCSHDVITYTWHGVESVPFASSKALAIEDIMLKKFNEQFGTKPLANVQANATQID